MKDSPLHRALRDMHLHLHKRVFWGAIAVVGLLLGLSGPFNTYDVMPLVPRLAYWGLVTGVTFLSGWFVSTWIIIAFEARGWPFWLEAGLAGLAVGAVISLEILGLNRLTFGLSPLDPDYAPGMVANTVVTSLVVTAAILWTRRNHQPAAAPQTAPQPPRLLTRLPLNKRGSLISLSVQDHYVEVVTSCGRELILMRLSDAIAETEGCDGLQVHRSHWVATDQVRASRRDGARGVLTMSDGREIPASRSFLPQVRAAGLLP